MGDICTDNRFELIEKYKKKLVEATNIETSPEEMAVLDNILFRFWQMGWLDSVDRMPLVKESARTLMHSVGDSIVAKAFRNAGRFVQNAIDGEPPEFEKLLLAQPEIIRCKDCKWFDESYPLGTYADGVFRCHRVKMLWMEKDAFCSYGERRIDGRPDFKTSGD